MLQRKSNEIKYQNKGTEQILKSNIQENLFELKIWNCILKENTYTWQFRLSTTITKYTLVKLLDFKEKNIGAFVKKNLFFLRKIKWDYYQIVIAMLYATRECNNIFENFKDRIWVSSISYPAKLTFKYKKHNTNYYQR